MVQQQADQLQPLHPDLFSDARIELIRNQIAKDAPDDVFAAMIDVARRRNLDPLAKQITLIRFRDTWQMIVTIDGYRAIAEQSGAYAGMDAPVFTYEEDERTAAGKRIPDSATVTVYKLIAGQRYPFSATVFWDEYSTGKNNWNTMPRTMLAKVAESHALRKAFPAVLSGTYTQEEMDQAIETTARVVDLPPQPKRATPAPRPQISRQSTSQTPRPNSTTDGKALHFRNKLLELQGAIQWSDDDLDSLCQRDFGKSLSDASGDELEAIHGDLRQMFREDPPALKDLQRLLRADPGTGEIDEALGEEVS